MPPIAKTSFSAFVAAMRPKVAGSSTSGGKKSTREDERALVVEPVDRGVVGRVEADEQVLGLRRDEALQQLLEPRRRVLRGAAAADGEARERAAIRPMVRRRRPKPPSS